MAAISVQEDGGGDYTTLEAAVENASTVDGDVITISGTWSADEDTQISVADALTTEATGDAKHSGVPWATGNTHWRHRNTSAGHSFTVTDTGSITYTGLDIQNTSTGSSDEVFRNNVSNTVIYNDCLLGFASRNDQQDLYYNEALITVTFNSCMFYNVYRSVVDAFNSDAGSAVNFNCCTGYEIGFSSNTALRSGLLGKFGTASMTFRIFNSIIEINTGNLVSLASGTDVTGHIHTGITNSGTLVNAITLTTDTDNVTSATITDSTASSAYILEDTTTSPFDLRLADHANNTAQDNHTNSSGAGLTGPSVDIVGTSRPQATNWDIAAFEIESVAAVTPEIVPPLAMRSYRFSGRYV